MDQVYQLPGRRLKSSKHHLDGSEDAEHRLPSLHVQQETKKRDTSQLYQLPTRQPNVSQGSTFSNRPLPSSSPPSLFTTPPSSNQSQSTQLYELPERRTGGSVKRKYEDGSGKGLEHPTVNINQPPQSATHLGSPTIVPMVVPQRHTWNKAQIDKLAKSSEVYEKTFGAVLQTQLGNGYQIHPHENKFNRHDFFITKSNQPDKKVWIELECGVTQHQWTNSIHDNRQRWVQGLNVVSRKIAEGKHFDLFIKHNKLGNSFFAATYEFIRSHGKVITQSKNSLGFKTDNVIYALPWTYVDNKATPNDNPFVVDDFSKLRQLIDTLFK